MMGSSGSSSEFGNLYDLLALVDDKSKYESKLRDLDNRVAEAKKTLEQAASNNKQAEEKRVLSQHMLDQATAKLYEANLVKAATEKAADDLTVRQDELDGRVRAHAAAVAEHVGDVKAHQEAAAAEHRALLARSDQVAVAERAVAELRAKAEADAAVIRDTAATELAEVHKYAATLDVARSELAKANDAFLTANAIAANLQLKRT